jgi:hypothetical protein
MCTDAYREALTRDLSSTASSAPTSRSAPSQRQAAEAGREGVVGRPAGAVAESRPAMALAKDATVGSGEVIDQR